MQICDIMRIAAFLPAYRPGLGAGLAVFFRDGTTGWMDLPLRSFIQRLAAAFTVDVQESRRRFGPIMGQKNLVPLALAPLFLFVPIKTRKPLVSGDPAYGYFRLRSVMEVGPDPKPTTICLEGGREITVQQSLRTVRSRLRTAHKLEAHLFEQFCLTINDRHQQFLSYPSFFPHQPEDGNIYGVVAERQEKRAGSIYIELRNLMEDLVSQQIDEALVTEQYGVCRCKPCRMDIAAIALNESKRYMDALDVVEVVTKAINEVRNNPRHEVNF